MNIWIRLFKARLELWEVSKVIQTKQWTKRKNLQKRLRIWPQENAKVYCSNRWGLWTLPAVSQGEMIAKGSVLWLTEAFTGAKGCIRLGNFIQVTEKGIIKNSFRKRERLVTFVKYIWCDGLKWIALSTFTTKHFRRPKIFCSRNKFGENRILHIFMVWCRLSLAPRHLNGV